MRRREYFRDERQIQVQGPGPRPDGYEIAIGFE
jgi:hypothetical protein